MMRRKSTLDDDLEALPGQRPSATSVDPATGEARVKPRGAWKFAALAFIAMVVVLALKNKFPQPTLFTKSPLIEASTTAQKSGKLLVIDFFGTWCPPCERMDKETWRDKQVERWVADHAVAVRVNSGSPNEKERAVAEAFGVREVPTVVLVRDGKEVGRKVGFIDGPALAEWFESRRTAPDESVRSTAGE
ncbi:MAG: thioredoxin family protein [Phycisphaerales bacterium]